MFPIFVRFLAVISHSWIEYCSVGPVPPSPLLLFFPLLPAYCGYCSPPRHLVNIRGILWPKLCTWAKLPLSSNDYMQLFCFCKFPPGTKLIYAGKSWGINFGANTCGGLYFSHSREYRIFGILRISAKFLREFISVWVHVAQVFTPARVQQKHVWRIIYVLVSCHGVILNIAITITLFNP